MSKIVVGPPQMPQIPFSRGNTTLAGGARGVSSGAARTSHTWLSAGPEEAQATAGKRLA